LEPWGVPKVQRNRRRSEPGCHSKSESRGTSALGLLALIVTVIVIAIAPAVPAMAAVAGEPTAQYRETIQTTGQETLASLFATLQEGYSFDISWIVQRLPCPATFDRLSATEASIETSQARSVEAKVHLQWAHLPRGIHCGSQLPFTSGQGKVKVEIVSQPPTKETGPPLVNYESNDVLLDSASTCVRLSVICDGKYLLIATLETLHSHLTFVYAFSILDATSSEQASNAKSSTSRPQMLQCPIRA
jgi:hypothetical protein